MGQLRAHRVGRNAELSGHFLVAQARGEAPGHQGFARSHHRQGHRRPRLANAVRLGHHSDLNALPSESTRLKELLPHSPGRSRNITFGPLELQQFNKPSIGEFNLSAIIQQRQREGRRGKVALGRNPRVADRCCLSNMRPQVCQTFLLSR